MATACSQLHDSSCQHMKVMTPKTDDVKQIYPILFDCAFCGKSSCNVKSCTRCWWAKYCNKTCQRNHWKQHKLECINDPSRSYYYRGGRVVELAMSNQEGPESSLNEDGCLFLDLDKCPKHGHNDHADFIGVQDFTLDKLPSEIRTDDVRDYILSEAKMTVRVLVKWTSKNRSDGDVCAKFRGTRHTRTASGTYVLDNAKDFQPKKCPIPNCHRAADLGPDHQIFEGDLKIFTNKHVLYDEEELHKTVVDFFYDSADRAGVVREYGTKMFYTKPTSDKTFLKVTIHDKDLFHNLEQYDLDKAIRFRQVPKTILKRMASFAIVISHPHGLPKKISIGRIKSVTEENLDDESRENSKLAGDLETKWFESRREEDYVRYMACLGQKKLPVYKVCYDTPICQGSSGAPVFFGGRENNGIWGPYIGNHTAHDLDLKLNFFKVVRFSFT